MAFFTISPSKAQNMKALTNQHRRLQACFQISLLVITGIMACICETAYAQEDSPSFKLRRQQLEKIGRFTEKLTPASFLFPASYGLPSAGSQYYEYIGDFSFTVDQNEGKVRISVDVIITTGEEAVYPYGEYVNVWIDWDSSGTFDSYEIVLDQMQYAEAVGFKGTLRYTATVNYPEDVYIASETWIRAVLGYGYDPGPTGSWTYGSAITKPISLGKTKMDGLQVWISESLTPKHRKKTWL